MNFEPLVKIIHHTTRQTPPSLHPISSRSFNSVMDKILGTDCYRRQTPPLLHPTNSRPFNSVMGKILVTFCYRLVYL